MSELKQRLTEDMKSAMRAKEKDLLMTVRNILAVIAQEELELGFIQKYLPEPLSDAEINELVAEAISSTGATSMKEMGKVMAHLKPATQGRADMGKISGMIKAALTS